MMPLILIAGVVAIVLVAFLAGVIWQRRRHRLFGRLADEARQEQQLRHNSARMRRQVLQAVKDLHGRDLGDLAAAQIICKHLGVAP
jgi:hypothetical protein